MDKHISSQLANEKIPRHVIRQHPPTVANAFRIAKEIITNHR